MSRNSLGSFKIPTFDPSFHGCGVAKIAMKISKRASQTCAVVLIGECTEKYCRSSKGCNFKTFETMFNLSAFKWFISDLQSHKRSLLKAVNAELNLQKDAEAPTHFQKTYSVGAGQQQNWQIDHCERVWRCSAIWSSHQCHWLACLVSRWKSTSGTSHCNALVFSSRFAYFLWLLIYCLT